MLFFPLIMKINRPSWEQYALELAKTASIRSEDPYVKVGAVAVRYDYSIAGVGYNGAPSGIEIDWSNREERRHKVIHAEANCLRYCRPGEIFFLAVTMQPCCKCITLIASYGIRKVIFTNLLTDEEERAKSFNLLNEYQIQIIKLDNDGKIIQQTT